MKTIAEIALETIVTLDLVSIDNIGINAVIFEGWDGVTQIVISEGDTIPEEHQLGVLSQTTSLTIQCYSEGRDIALSICRQIERAVYLAITKLECKGGTGILAIMRDSRGAKNMSDNRGFVAFCSFNVLNTINM